MSALQDCLADLAVGSWANNDSALDLCRDSLRSYLDSVGADPDARARALKELNGYFSDYKWESTVAEAIKKDIDDKLLEIPRTNVEAEAPESSVDQDRRRL